MCVGKALTGGYLTLAATLCTARVAAGISEGEVPVLAHGPTFMGNPLAARGRERLDRAAAGQDWRAGGRADRGRPARRAGARRGICRACADVRVLGAIGVVQLDHEVDMAAATAAPRSRRGCGCGRSAT